MRKDRRQFVAGLGSLGAISMLPACASLYEDSDERRAQVARAVAQNFADEYRDYDGLALAELVRRKEVQPIELLRVAWNRLRKVDPQLNALAENLFKRAASEITTGLPQGPFTGVPFLLKDLNMYLRGTVTTNGSRLWEKQVAEYTSTIVERYRKAGLVICGKTTSPEFGGTATTESTLFGATRNPWNTDFTPGGSSGGSAALVAAGVTPLANATDGGGSIRIPASCCGLFGLKPTRARTPSGPVSLENWGGFSVAHAVTRSVRDSAALLDATRGPEPGSPYWAPAPPRPYLEETRRDPGKLRIALVREPATRTKVHKDCIDALAVAAELCQSLGHEIEEAAFPVMPLPKTFNAAGTMMGVGLLRTVTKAAEARGRELLDIDLELINWLRIKQARKTTGLEVVEARHTLHEATRAMALFQKSYDLILSPTMATPPARLGVWALNQSFEKFARNVVHASAFTLLYNITGQPAMSVPLHWNAQGLPIGVMFAARYSDEGLLFRMASQLEQAKPWFHRRPPIA